MPGTRLSMMATVQARHSTITSLSGGKRGMTSTAGWPGRRAFVRYAAIPCSIKSARKVNNPTSTRRPPYVNSVTCLGGGTVAVFWEGSEEMFSFDGDVGIFEDLEERVT